MISILNAKHLDETHISSKKKKKKKTHLSSFNIAITQTDSFSFVWYFCSSQVFVLWVITNKQAIIISVGLAHTSSLNGCIQWSFAERWSSRANCLSLPLPLDAQTIELTLKKWVSEVPLLNFVSTQTHSIIQIRNWCDCDI